MSMMMMRGEPRGASKARWWVYVLVGIIFILAGIFCLWDVVAASVASAIFIGAVLVVGGAFQIVHAFWERGWEGFLLSLLVGILYLLGGLAMLSNPVAGLAVITLVIAVMLIISGIARLVLAWQLRPLGTWLLVVSGVLAIALGALIFAGWPASGLVILGIFLGLDLLWFGIWWTVLGFALRSAQA